MDFGDWFFVGVVFFGGFEDWFFGAKGFRNFARYFDEGVDRPSW